MYVLYSQNEFPSILVNKKGSTQVLPFVEVLLIKS